MFDYTRAMDIASIRQNVRDLKGSQALPNFKINISIPSHQGITVIMKL